QAREVDVGDHRDEDRPADDDVEGEGIDALQGEPVLQHAEHDPANQAADNRPAAAGDGGAADHTRGDAEEHDVAAAGERVDRADTERFEEAGKTAQGAG